MRRPNEGQSTKFKETIMIAAVMLMSVALVVILCVVAYTLATYALPLMLGLPSRVLPITPARA